jgi:hypothetical protein
MAEAGVDRLDAAFPLAATLAHRWQLSTRALVLVLGGE